ncbi:DUF2744 domain-containing protein [Nocardia vinacea]|uniref:phage gene 29 protein family protein n=1 Tax=Nocardia vinacea TaxID=96468 RepID=UPI0033EE2CB9
MTIDVVENSARQEEIAAIKATFQNVPGMQGAAMMIPPPMAEIFAVHQWECGVRVDPSKAEKKYIAPFRGPRHAYNNAGRYAPIDSAEPEPATIPNMKEYTAEELQAIIAQLEGMGAIKHPEPQQDTAFVVSE